MDVLIYRAGIVALIALYATVLLRIMQPEVSPAYRDYYITRDSTLSPHEAQALGSLPPVRPGDHLTHQAPVLAFARGWSHAEATHRFHQSRDIAFGAFALTRAVWRSEGFPGVTDGEAETTLTVINR